MSYKVLSFADNWYWFVVIALVTYFIGCFNFAVFISHVKKKDIRSSGSGNPGAMNMTRTFGFKIGLLNFFCDVFKGGVPVLVLWLVFRDYVFAGTEIVENGFVTGGFVVSDLVRYLGGSCIILGHVFPVFLKFKGGKGIAATIGVYAFSLPCEQWWYFFIVLALCLCVLAYIALTEWGSMGSLIAVAGLTVFQGAVFIIRYENVLLSCPMIITLMMLLGINLLTWLRHNTNIYRLLQGEERRTAVRKHKDKT